MCEGLFARDPPLSLKPEHVVDPPDQVSEEFTGRIPKGRHAERPALQGAKEKRSRLRLNLGYARDRNVGLARKAASERQDGAIKIDVRKIDLRCPHPPSPFSVVQGAARAKNQSPAHPQSRRSSASARHSSAAAARHRPGDRRADRRVERQVPSRPAFSASAGPCVAGTAAALHRFETGTRRCVNSA